MEDIPFCLTRLLANVKEFLEGVFGVGANEARVG